MQWIKLTTEEQLTEISDRSHQRPQVIFKHSTRCSISSTALVRLEKAQAPSDVDFFFLDLLQHRGLSNKVAQTFGVNHESPQVLIIKQGQCIFDESHLGISMADIKEQALASF
jgi:bacillithiol system protein YtxJ